MKRFMAGLMLAGLIGAATANAAEYKGTLDKFEPRTRKLTVTLDDQVKSFEITLATKTIDFTGKEVTGQKRLLFFRPGDPVVVTTEIKGDKEIVLKVEQKKK